MPAGLLLELKSSGKFERQWQVQPPYPLAASTAPLEMGQKDSTILARKEPDDTILEQQIRTLAMKKPMSVRYLVSMKVVSMIGKNRCARRCQSI